MRNFKNAPLNYHKMNEADIVIAALRRSKRFGNIVISFMILTSVLEVIYNLYGRDFGGVCGWSSSLVVKLVLLYLWNAYRKSQTNSVQHFKEMNARLDDLAKKSEDFLSSVKELEKNTFG